MENRRLFDLLQWQKQTKPRPDALASYATPQWRKYSTDELIETVDGLSRGLAALGLQKGDKVAIIADSCPEWAIADLAILQLGCVSVPVYPILNADDYAYILNHSEAKAVFVGAAEFWDKLHTVWEDIPGLDHAFALYPDSAEPPHWRSILQAEGIDLTPLKAAVAPDDLATLVYTSGTTGRPKGVMLTHHNILSNAISVSDSGLMPDATHVMNQPDFRALSFLPMSHIFERTAIFAYLYRCIPIYFARSTDTVAEDLQTVQPFFFTAVPRLLEKVYEKIQLKAKTLSSTKRKLLFWAMDLVKDYDPAKAYGPWFNIRLAFARKMIFSKWHEALGGNVGMILVGSAPMPTKIAHVFWGANIPVLEAYGLTESSPGITGNRFDPQKNRIGTVGQAFDGVEVKIDELEGYRKGEGEILARGPNIFQGYYKNPEATRETLDADGWLHTGDIGMIDREGFLKITGRKKQLFKTAYGKYVAPEAVENKLKESFFVEQAMVVGEYKKFIAALLVPNYENLTDWAASQGITANTPEALLENPKVHQLYKNEVVAQNGQLPRHERIKRFKLCPAEWTPETGELTPTMKVKRKVIEENFQHAIEHFFDDTPPQDILPVPAREPAGKSGKSSPEKQPAA